MRLLTPSEGRHDYRALYRSLLAGGGHIEATGWADESVLENASEMQYAWWQADALAFDARRGLVRVRYRGYEDDTEDEWRPLSQLRRYEARPSSAWRNTRRTKGEAVEVAWAPPGHRSARWEAEVVDSRPAKAKVRFVGFDASWDMWLAHH